MGTRVVQVGGNAPKSNLDGEQTTTLISPDVPTMNANLATITLQSDETVKRTFSAKHGCCHVLLPADDTSQTILTNKRVVTSVTDHNHACLVIPTGEYTRKTESFDLNDVVHVAALAHNPGYFGIMPLLTNTFCPAPSELRLSMSKPGLVVGWMHDMIKPFFTGISLLNPLCHGATSKYSAQEVVLHVKRSEIQAIASDVSVAIGELKQKQSSRR